MTIAMPVAPGADPRSYPLIDRLFATHGYTEVDAANFEAFSGRAGHTLLVFVEDPVRFKESLDLAVIVPEIDRAFQRCFAVGVLLPEAARAFQAHYGFRRWPALVMLKDGGYAGAVDGLRNWDEYLDEVARLLAAPASRPPAVGVAVTVAGEGRKGPGACSN